MSVARFVLRIIQVLRLKSQHLIFFMQSDCLGLCREVVGTAVWKMSKIYLFLKKNVIFLAYLIAKLYICGEINKF